MEWVEKKCPWNPKGGPIEQNSLIVKSKSKKNKKWKNVVREK